MSGYYNLKKDKKNVYWIFGFVSFMQIVIVSYALFVLVVSGPQAQVNVLSFLGGVYYVPAEVCFFASALVSASCFGYFCYYIAGDLKRKDADKLLETFRKNLKHLESEIRNDFENKFAKISMDQFMITQNFKDVEAKIARYNENVEAALQNLIKIKDFLDKQTIQNRSLKKKVEEVNSNLTLSSNVGRVVGADGKGAEAFKSVGTKRVQELTAADSAVSADKTGLSGSLVAKVQAAAKRHCSKHRSKGC